MPDIPDDPGIQPRIIDPGFSHLGAVGGKSFDVGPQCLDCANVPQPPRHILLEPVLARAVDNTNISSRREQVPQPADAFEIAGPNEIGRRSQI